MQTRYPVLFIPILLFGLYFSYRVSRAGGKSSKEQIKSFMDQEHESKFVRSKPIEESAFIIPDLTKLPIKDFGSGMETLSENDAKLLNKQEKVIKCADKKMLTFKNADNLELKMKYGYGTFEEIIVYETNYEGYLNALSEWAQMLAAQGHCGDALTVLKEAIAIGGDTSKNFILLADLYKNEVDINSLLSLKKNVIETGSIMTNKIIAHIDNVLEDIGYGEA